jgi:putative spermidine/putrescine transport system substrate-binding protein
MEWSLNPKVQGDLASWFGSVPAVPDACRNNALLGADGCRTNGIDNFDQIAFWKTPQADCFDPGGDKECVPYSQWATNYVAVIGGR